MQLIYNKSNFFLKHIIWLFPNSQSSPQLTRPSLSLLHQIRASSDEGLDWSRSFFGCGLLLPLVLLFHCCALLVLSSALYVSGLLANEICLTGCKWCQRKQTSNVTPHLKERDEEKSLWTLIGLHDYFCCCHWKTQRRGKVFKLYILHPIIRTKCPLHLHTKYCLCSTDTVHQLGVY